MDLTTQAILAQAILPDGAISADWVMVIMGVIIGSLITVILSRIVKMIDLQQKELVIIRDFMSRQDERNKAQDRRNELYDKGVTISQETAKILDSMYTKLKAMQG